jgi:excisionase family DNA binding protein
VTSLLLKPLEVAELLGLSRSKVFEMLAAEDLPVVRIGRAVRVPRGDLEEWIRERTRVRQVGEPWLRPRAGSTSRPIGREE